MDGTFKRNIMSNRSAIRKHWIIAALTALVALTVLAALAFFVYNPFRETVMDTANYNQSQFAGETEDVDGIIERPSPGELAHNENYFGLGRLENRDYEGAIEKFISAATHEPGNLEYRANLALAYEKNGQHDNAIDQLTFALTFQPNNSDYLSLLGNAYFSKEQWADAAEAYDSALKYGANDHRMLFNAAQVYLEIGTLIKAIGAIDSAIALNEDDPDYHRISGIIKCKFKRYEEAIEDFEVARKMDPDNLEVDQWIQYAAGLLRNRHKPGKAYKTHDQAGEYPQDSGNSHQDEVDDIFRRMEKLKEEFMNRQ